MIKTRSTTQFCSPRRVLVKVALGEAPDAVPTVADVRAGATRAPARLGVGPVDRVLGHFSDGRRVARVHGAATAMSVPGLRHTGFSDLEHALGLARTFRVDVEVGTPIGRLVSALRQVAEVEEACPDYFAAVPFSTAAALDEALSWQPRELVRSAEAMAYETGDPAVIVAFLDTGASAASPELAGRLRNGLDTVQLRAGDFAPGVRLVGDERDIDEDTDDDVGHGTSCAAIAGAAGTAIPPGMGGGCGLLPMRVLGAALLPGRSEPIGVGAISDINAGFKRAVDVGAKVVNMSFGTRIDELDSGDPVPHLDEVRYALAHGCILVAASGNSGMAEAFSPASLDGVIAVSACGTEGHPSAFATRGRHVALAAPGERILTATRAGYGLVTGTSFAAPFVSATAALLASRAARRARPIDGHLARQLLIQSAASWAPGVEHEGHGAGVLDAHAALLALDRHFDLAPNHLAGEGHG